MVPFLIELGGQPGRHVAGPTTRVEKVQRAATLDGVAGGEVVLNDAVREVLTELASPEPLPAKKKAKRRPRKKRAKKAKRKVGKKITKKTRRKAKR